VPDEKASWTRFYPYCLGSAVALPAHTPQVRRNRREVAAEVLQNCCEIAAKLLCNSAAINEALHNCRVLLLQSLLNHVKITANFLCNRTAILA
jgi:hypothetical protein